MVDGEWEAARRLSSCIIVTSHILCGPTSSELPLIQIVLIYVQVNPCEHAKTNGWVFPINNIRLKMAWIISDRCGGRLVWMMPIGRCYWTGQPYSGLSICSVNDKCHHICVRETAICNRFCHNHMHEEMLSGLDNMSSAFTPSPPKNVVFRTILFYTQIFGDIISGVLNCSILSF